MFTKKGKRNLILFLRRLYFQEKMMKVNTTFEIDSVRRYPKDEELEKNLEKVGERYYNQLFEKLKNKTYTFKNLKNSGFKAVKIGDNFMKVEFTSSECPIYLINSKIDRGVKISVTTGILKDLLYDTIEEQEIRESKALFH